MLIGVLGGNGFVGKTIVETLRTDHAVININRENYKLQNNIKFDVLVNANGNSHKYLANLNPLEDFEKNVSSVYKTLYDFKFKKYIYISSIDVETVRTSYGLHKHLSEKLVKFHCSDYSIIRLPAVIGKNATKGVVYDILNGNNVYITPKSTMMLMDVNSISLNLKILLEKNKLKKVERFYPCDNITVEQIGSVLNKLVKYGSILREEYFQHKGFYDKSINYLKKIM